MRMVLRAMLALASMLIGGTGGHVAAAAGLVNGSFELPVAAPDGFVNGSIQGWSGPTGQPFFFGVTSQISSLPTLIDGSQAAFVNNFGGGGGIPTSHAICQQLSEVLEPDAAYTFSAFFGQRSDNAGSLGSIELWAGGSVSQGSVIGGTLLASQSVALIQGQFVPASVAYLCTASSPHVGKQISVRLVATPLANAFAQANFDAAKLSISTISSCPGDLNRDFFADDLDFSLFVLAYNNLVCPDAPTVCTGDLNHDGVVDDADFSVFVVNYDELFCPEARLHYVTQSRFVSASGCPTNTVPAFGFGPFDQNAFGACNQQGSATATQRSVLDDLQITLQASIGGQLGTFGGLAAESAFTVVFDIVGSERSFSLTYDGREDSNRGAPSLTGPGTNLQIVPTTGGPLKGTLQPGRYTLKVDVFGPGFVGGFANLNFSVSLPGR